MAVQNSSRAELLFYSSVYEDETLRGQLNHHLTSLQRQGYLLPWHGRQINAGEDWQHAISEHLEAALILFLLISPGFLASDHCYEIERQRTLERQQVGQARAIPLILCPCDWQIAPFGHLQALPLDGCASTTRANQDEAILQVSRSLRTLLMKPNSVSKTSGKEPQNRVNMLIKLQ